MKCQDEETRNRPERKKANIDYLCLLIAFFCFVAYLIPFMTFIESFVVESSINVFQLFCSEKLFKTLSHMVTHCAASIGSKASIILSSRFHAQNMIRRTMINMELQGSGKKLVKVTHVVSMSHLTKSTRR